MNTVGFDWDDINFDEAKTRFHEIQDKEDDDFYYFLYETKHGYHLILVFPCEITSEENIKLRKKYWDDPQRIKVGISRFKTTGRIQDLDVLFTRKNGHIRRMIL